MSSTLGSTLEGESLRGMGQFLKGAAWYELNSAKAFELNAKATIELEKWNREVYDAYQRELSAARAYRKNVTKAQAEAAQQRYEEREARLRREPTPEDIRNGDALNALLLDLSRPSVSQSSWRAAQVPLPKGLSIRSLVFRFAPEKGNKGGQSLSTGLIALGTLDPENWPSWLREPGLAAERQVYELVFCPFYRPDFPGAQADPEVAPQWPQDPLSGFRERPGRRPYAAGASPLSTICRNGPLSFEKASR
jgi:hypothetical protein